MFEADLLTALGRMAHNCPYSGLFDNLINWVRKHKGKFRMADYIPCSQFEVEDYLENWNIFLANNTKIVNLPDPNDRANPVWEFVWGSDVPSDKNQDNKLLWPIHMMVARGDTFKPLKIRLCKVTVQICKKNSVAAVYKANLCRIRLSRTIYTEKSSVGPSGLRKTPSRSLEGLPSKHKTELIFFSVNRIYIKGRILKHDRNGLSKMKHYSTTQFQIRQWKETQSGLKYKWAFVATEIQLEHYCRRIENACFILTHKKATVKDGEDCMELGGKWSKDEITRNLK